VQWSKNQALPSIWLKLAALDRDNAVTIVTYQECDLTFVTVDWIIKEAASIHLEDGIALFIASLHLMD
jgi:hypothetical protein